MKKLFKNIMELSANRMVTLIKIFKDSVRFGDKRFLIIETLGENSDVFNKSFQNLKFVKGRNLIDDSDSLSDHLNDKFREINEKKSNQ